MKFGWETELDRLALTNDMHLATLDGRSRASGIFSHKIECSDYDTISRFIEWGVNNLGSFSVYDIFFDSLNFQNPSRISVSWLINSKKPQYNAAYAEFYIRKKDLPLILLYWQDSK